ncbi:MAG: GemA protein [Microbacterium sp.]|nr:MAG: GemA protein [Microbacterium sp.]
MTQPASAAQIRAIHSYARAAGLDEDSRRDFMERETGKRSSSDLDVRQAIRVIDGLKKLAPAAVAKPKRMAAGALALDGPFVGKIRALWISAHLLGVVRDPSDTAMVAFVLRQTGVEHQRWASKTLGDPAAARKVIEALKKWLTREADVQWGEEEPDGEGAKRAVYLAIRRKLTAAGVDPNFAEFPGRRFLFAAGAELDALTRHAAERLAQAKAGEP